MLSLLCVAWLAREIGSPVTHVKRSVSLNLMSTYIVMDQMYMAPFFILIVQFKASCEFSSPL